jgi:hypothetical protein
MSVLDEVGAVLSGPGGAALKGAAEGILGAIVEAARAPGLDERQSIDRMFANVRGAVDKAEAGNAAMDAARHKADLHAREIERRHVEPSNAVAPGDDVMGAVVELRNGEAPE